MTNEQLQEYDDWCKDAETISSTSGLLVSLPIKKVRELVAYARQLKKQVEQSTTNPPEPDE